MYTNHTYICFFIPQNAHENLFAQVRHYESRQVHLLYNRRKKERMNEKERIKGGDGESKRLKNKQTEEQQNIYRIHASQQIFPTIKFF